MLYTLRNAFFSPKINYIIRYGPLDMQISGLCDLYKSKTLVEQNFLAFETTTKVLKISIIVGQILEGGKFV